MKHAGDLVAAAALADEARCMDLADRYINSECVKRMLQADQVLMLCFVLILIPSVIVVFGAFFACFYVVVLYMEPFLEGGFGRKNCSLVHQGWGSAQQPS